MPTRCVCEYSSLQLREIATICYVRFDQHLSHKTVKQVLTETASPANVMRRYPPFHTADGAVIGAG